MNKLVITLLLGAVAISGAVAGTYCPPPAKGGKCPVDCCPETNGNISVSYGTDYIFRGVRLANDHVAADVNYTFDRLCLPVTVGYRHVSSLGSAVDLLNNGDHSNLYASVALPSILGFDAAVGYDHYFYPNWNNGNNNTPFGSHGAVSLDLSREILCGIIASYNVAYDFGWPHDPYGNALTAMGSANNADHGAWLHTVTLAKSFCITDCISLDLSGGVLYSDNVWPAGSGSDRSAGWNNYFFHAGLPIAINCNATLTPYLGYNGTPDSWMADGVGFPNTENKNDVFHGGVKFGVTF